MKEEVFYKHVRETTFTKDYTVCGKVVEVSKAKFTDNNEYIPYQYELHIGVYVFPVDHQFIKKVGITGSELEAISDPLVKIKVDEYSLHTFLDFCKVFCPVKAIKKKVYLNQVIE